MSRLSQILGKLAMYTLAITVMPLIFLYNLLDDLLNALMGEQP